jgi:acyl-homoserine-lactone acylase
MKNPFKIAFYCLFLAIHSIGLLASGNNSYPFSLSIDPQRISITRDLWGTPHIYAPTDAEVAYGLAWANAEDAFEQMQEALLVGKGMLGRVRGAEGAKADFFRHAIDAEGTVERQFATDISADFLRYLEGYCLGINDFAQAHPKRILLKDAFPINPKDILQSYLVAFSFLSGVGDAVAAGMSGDFSELETRKALGSNAYAINSSLSDNGHTYLCTNPHFMVDGPLSFYEAHLQSDEGLNIAGALFQGCASVCLGSNTNLGWGMTFNHFDRVDMYELKMHPIKPNYYEFEGKWCKLEDRPVKLKVKIGPVTIPVKRKSFWSVYGPTFKSETGKLYALRAPSYTTIKAAEQYYRMNKARNLTEFKAALSLQGLPLFNIVYADKDDNLLYISNGLYPKRDTSYNWRLTVPGNTQKTLWTSCHSIAELPQVENPNCGYIFNCNNTPYNATCAAENTLPTLPQYADSRPGNTNRALRFMELIAGKNQISFTDFKAIKFDNSYPANGKFIESLQPLLAMNPDQYADIAPQIRLMQQWSRQANLDSIAPTYYLIALTRLFEQKKYQGDEPFLFGFSASEKDFADAIRYSKHFLERRFKTTDVPLKSVQRYLRSDGDQTVAGFADVMMANYAMPYKNGKYKLIFGDTYIHFADFSSEGLQRIESLLPFSLNSAKNKGYADQLDMYNRQITKPIYLEQKSIQSVAQISYHPKKDRKKGDDIKTSNRR